MSPESAAARHVLRAYFAELASRYYGRPATDEEVAAAMREEPSADPFGHGPYSDHWYEKAIPFGP